MPVSMVRLKSYECRMKMCIPTSDLWIIYSEHDIMLLNMPGVSMDTVYWRVGHCWTFR